jgi:hypothetical protein
LGLDEALHRSFHHAHTRFLGDYALSLLFSAKHMPTLVDLRHFRLKTPKYPFYQRIKCILEGRSLVFGPIGSAPERRICNFQTKF